jgi:hypothetical protein
LRICVVNIPTKIIGNPNPNAYESKRKNANVGVVIASVKILPRIAPMHGVQLTANDAPIINEVK